MTEPVRALLASVLVLLLGGCSAIPGMRVESSTPTGDYPVHTIDGTLVEKMARQGRDETRAAGGAGADTPDYEYRVGPGDVLSIVVWNHPELTNPYGQAEPGTAAGGRLVRADGTIFFPYVGEVRAQGLTVQQIQQRLQKGLRPYVKEPQVNVRVQDYRSKQVYVTGEVRKPGTLPLTDRPTTVLDALSASGGFTQRIPNQNPYGANERRALLTRGNRTVAINLQQLYRTGRGNRVLHDGDILYVPDDSDNKVFVLGEVNKQTTVPLHNGELTLAEAIAGADGVDLSKANTEQIYVIRGVPEDGADGQGPRIVPKIYRLDASNATALLLADAFPMHPRDVVLVSTTEIVRWNRVMQQILPTIQAGYQLRVIDRGFAN